MAITDGNTSDVSATKELLELAGQTWEKMLGEDDERKFGEGGGVRYRDACWKGAGGRGEVSKKKSKEERNGQKLKTKK